ncbi:hypothetical protein ACRALDRAFT_1082896 [Sodiomyces alcalophilus JCM 7366]|uniref:uncharacterized protein n=1 Tax=Sodiomyces alcalophilus JCM 7366 TaxID=591952 RepID=UPI0039B634F0
MNCPSRTDGATLEHPEWNQSPPFLAADLTTCEDLNGIVNARAHRRGGKDDVCLEGSSEKLDHLTHPHFDPDSPGPGLPGRWEPDSSRPRSKDVFGGEDQPRPHAMVPQQPAAQASRLSAAWRWISWTASVLACSALLSYFRFPPSFSPPAIGTRNATADDPPRALLTRRLDKRSTCGSGVVDSAEYDLPLHVGALFIMIAVSFLACAFPLIAKRFPFLRTPPAFFFAVRHFGTGVLIATAFVHLLPTAFILLGDPCLPDFWVKDYPAMPGAIALAAVFLVTVIEMVFQPARRYLPPQSATDSSKEDAADSTTVVATTPRGPKDPNRRAGASESLGQTLSRLNRHPSITSRNPDATAAAAAAASAELGATTTTTNTLKEATTDEERNDAGTPHSCSGSCHAQAGYILTPAQKHQKAILQCVMLEAGILFHSVFIGMTLAVSTGSAFVVLLIAIVFHQTFEGLALGSRIADISWHDGALQPWLMALAYGFTTPVGQAIGIGTHSLYDPESEFGLILVGTMNAISSGLLVYASLVELLAEDFLSDESWRVLRGKKRVVACLLVFAGAFGMSLVGAWA